MYTHKNNSKNRHNRNLSSIFIDNSIPVLANVYIRTQAYLCAPQTPKIFRKMIDIYLLRILLTCHAFYKFEFSASCSPQSANFHLCNFRVDL